MSAPAQSDYAEAVQNPRLTFSDARLQASHPALTKFQIPQASSGGFAIAFRLQGSAESWAVRCFTHDATGLAARYSAISRFLGDATSAPFVPIQYLPNGIRVGSTWWPVTVMPWVVGQTLNDWVQAHLGDPFALAGLRDQVKAIAAELELRRIAHGDLQHGNVLVRSDGKVVLIDYDGMFVPDLAGAPMLEIGHLNYQHPERAKAKFGPDLDRFSLAVIWSALEILEHSPDLWKEFDNGENLLFLRADFVDPSTSPLIRALRRDSKLAVIADRIARLSLARVDDIPKLSDVLAGKLPAPAPSVEVRVPGAISQYQIVDLRRGDIELYEGDRVTVVGEVLSSYAGQTVRGDPYVFVTLGSGSHRFKVVVWSQVLAGLGWAASRPRTGSLASVTGLITRYKLELQLELERPALFEAITGERAAELVGSGWRSAPPTYQRLTHPRDGDVVLHGVYGKGEVVRSRSDVATVRFGTTERDIQFTKFELQLVSRKPRSSGRGGPRPTPGPPLPAPTRPPAPPTPSPVPSPPTKPVGGPVPGNSRIAKDEADKLNALYGGSSAQISTKPSPAPNPPAATPTQQPTTRRTLQSPWAGAAVIAIGAAVGLQIGSVAGAAIGAFAAASSYWLLKGDS